MKKKNKKIIGAKAMKADVKGSESYFASGETEKK